MFDAKRISTAETNIEEAAYSSNDTISGYLYTIILSMARIMWQGSNVAYRIRERSDQRAPQVIQVV